jgi:hypothetical protein
MEFKDVYNIVKIISLEEVETVMTNAERQLFNGKMATRAMLRMGT